MVAVNGSEALWDIASCISRSVTSKFPSGGGGKKIAIGADGEPTRVFDKVAEDAALERISDLGLEWNIYSEEMGERKGRGDITLILDPIDGTNNAISSIPFFSTSLALLDEGSGKITDALVMNIPTGEIYQASIGKGAFKNKLPIRSRELDLEKAVVSSYIGPEAKGWTEELLFWPKRTRYFGCISLEICLVASGSLDLFVMFGRIPRLTDVAASELILKEAGGRTFILDKDNSLTEFRIDFMRGSTKAFFAFGDPTSIKRVFEISRVEYHIGDQ